MSVYGAARDDTPVSEQAPANPVDLYGAAKRYIEIYGQSLARETTFVALRIATICAVIHLAAMLPSGMVPEDRLHGSAIGYIKSWRAMSIDTQTRHARARQLRVTPRAPRSHSCR
jgi:hypothetical protein